MGQDTLRDEHLAKARELGNQTTLVDWSYRWRVAQARLRDSDGDLDTALDLLDEAKRVYVKNPMPDTRPIDALKAAVYLKQGRLDKALAWVRERGLSASDEITYLNEFEHLILARVLIAEAQLSHTADSMIQSVGLLERLRNASEAQRRMGSLIEILAALSLGYQAQGNPPQARAALAQALELAQPEGYVRIFVDHGEPMRLLIEDCRSMIEHRLLAYLDRLSIGFSKGIIPNGSSQSKISHPQSAILPESLSERELEVLRLIAKGLSNSEISQRLVLALSTVKGHNLRIFGKLQVQNRTEAVARARELGLL
jgi:LuxR family maltose regulon positive regulatory protein